MFEEERKKLRRVGPRWLRRAMLHEVRAMIPVPPMAENFNARRSWLRRFTKRFGLVLRRKTNNNKIPITERVPFLQRWFAVTRIFLKSKHDQISYDARWSLYPIRGSLDHGIVPAGDFDPKTTYETRGVKRVPIASNEAFDKYRWCTLQILLLNRKLTHLPRHGQPRLCMCFRGTGQRIGDDERAQYHPDVHDIVLFQPKAWFDSVTCNKWVVEVVKEEIAPLADKLPRRQRILVLGDNLSGQT